MQGAIQIDGPRVLFGCGLPLKEGCGVGELVHPDMSDGDTGVDFLDTHLNQIRLKIANEDDVTLRAGETIEIKAQFMGATKDDGGVEPEGVGTAGVADTDLDNGMIVVVTLDGIVYLHIVKAAVHLG